MTHTEAVALLDAWCLLHERHTTEHPEGEVAYYQKTRPFHEVTFDASNLSSGVYFYTLNSGNMVETRKMILTK